MIEQGPAQVAVGYDRAPCAAASSTTSPWRQIVELYRPTQPAPPAGWRERYNLAPTQDALVVRERDGAREAAMLRWGLVPFWSKEPDAGYSTINARSETVATRPTFREPFKRRRCIVPASGFYEWRAEPGSKGKQPYHIRRADGEPMSFAGLWDRWQRGDTEPIESLTIIVGAAPPSIAPYHDRAPVILDPEHFDVWLDSATEPKMLAPLLAPFDGPVMIGPVPKAAINPKNDWPELLRVVGA